MHRNQNCTMTSSFKPRCVLQDKCQYFYSGLNLYGSLVDKVKLGRRNPTIFQVPLFRANTNDIMALGLNISRTRETDSRHAVLIPMPTTPKSLNVIRKMNKSKTHFSPSLCHSLQELRFHGYMINPVDYI